MACVYTKQFSKSEYTSNDLDKLKEVGFDSPKEFEDSIKSNDWVYLGSIEDAYKDIKQDSLYQDLSYNEFLKEVNKGYGNSGILEIRRCLVLSKNRVYYDNNYVD